MGGYGSLLTDGLNDPSPDFAELAGVVDSFELSFLNALPWGSRGFGRFWLHVMACIPVA